MMHNVDIHISLFLTPDNHPVLSLPHIMRCIMQYHVLFLTSRAPHLAIVTFAFAKDCIPSIPCSRLPKCDCLQFFLLHAGCNLYCQCVMPRARDNGDYKSQNSHKMKFRNHYNFLYLEVKKKMVSLGMQHEIPLIYIALT